MTLKPELHGSDFTDYFDKDTYLKFMQVQIELERVIISRSVNLDPLDDLMLRVLGYLRDIMSILIIFGTQEFGRQHYIDLNILRGLIVGEINTLICSVRSFLPRDEQTKLPYLEPSCNFDDLLVPCREYIAWRWTSVHTTQDMVQDRISTLQTGKVD